MCNLVSHHFPLSVRSLSVGVLVAYASVHAVVSAVAASTERVARLPTCYPRQQAAVVAVIDGVVVSVGDWRAVTGYSELNLTI